MIKTKGFSLIAFLVIVTVLVILGSISVPLFNSYKQTLEVNEGMSYVLNFQKDVESCVFERQNLADCDLNEFGIETPPSLDEYGIIGYAVENGTIRVTFDNENLSNDIYPVEVAFYANPKMRETVPTVEWTVYCNDYDAGNNQLYKQCTDHIDNMPTKLPDDWVTWKEFSTPWRTIGGIDYTSNWTPPANMQTENYVQTRGFSYAQERDLIKKIKNLNTGQVVENFREREERTISDTENRNVSVELSDWKDLNQTKACSDWEPPRDEVEKGVEYEQSRDCSIEQEREYVHRVGNNQPIHRRDENQIVQSTETRDAKGTMKVWFPIDPVYTSWYNKGSGYDYSSWSPTVSTQTQDFTQQRDYQQNQERIVAEREQHSLNGNIRTVDTYEEQQTITRTEERQINVAPSGWLNTASPYACSSWTPETSTVDENKTLEQSRVCSQDQQRTWTYTANSNVVDIRQENKTINVSQTQTVSGTNPVWVTTSPTYTDWVNVGNRNYTENWSPAVLNQTSDFNQSRDYEQSQQRTRTNREIRPKTGDIRTVSTTTESKTITGSENRTVVVNVNGYSNSSSIYDCSTWTPDTSTVDEDETFTQTRTCQQDQERTWTYKVGSTTIDSRVEGRTVNRNQTQVVSGTNPVWIATDPTYTAWADFGSRSYVGRWTPAASNQTSDFVQDRDYNQGQERTRNNREIRPATGDIRTVSTTRETQTVTRTANRSVDVTASGWSNNSGIYSCSAWSPATSTVDEDETFTQSRTCQQDQERTWTYKVDSTTIDLRVEERTVNRNQTKVVSGSNPVWVATTPTYTTWTDFGSRNYIDSWSPVVSNQTSDFTQDRDFEQTQERTRNNREIRPATGEVKTVSTTRETQTITETATRTVSVSSTGWANDGGKYNCRNWSPDPSTVESGQSFTQTGVCNQDQTRTWTYKVGSTTLDTREESNTLTNVSHTRTLTGTDSVDGVCQYNRLDSGNKNYITSFLGTTLYWNNTYYYKPWLFYGGSSGTLTGSGTKSNPYVVIATGEKFYRGDFVESTSIYLTLNYYEVCKLN